MGGTTLIMIEKGHDVNELFDSLVDEAIYHDGHSEYNGTISTTSLGHEIKDEKLKKALKNDNWKVIEEYDNILFREKRKTNYALILDHYKAFTPKWVKKQSEVKRQKGVQTLQQFTFKIKGKETYKTYSTLTECKKHAKAAALYYGVNIEILQKRSNKERIVVGEFVLETDGKEYKSKRESKTKVYLPINEVHFFVYASS